MTHTPGPWRIDRDHDEDEIAIVGKPTWGATRFGVKGEWEVCKVETDTEDTKANARLIAAAPDLLAALEMAWDLCQDWLPIGDDRATQIESAIAKARNTPALHVESH